MAHGSRCRTCFLCADRFFVESMADDLNAVTREIRRLQRLEKSYLQRRDRITGLTAFALQTSLCIACLCSWNFNLAVDWLMSSHRRGSPVSEEADAETLRERLEDYFLRSDVNALLDWVDPQSAPVKRSVVVAAMNWVGGCRLRDWVQFENRNNGRVVTTARLVLEFNALRDTVNQNAVPLTPVLPASETPGRMWALRWRRKHNGRIRRLRPIEPLQQEEIRNKVP